MTFEELKSASAIGAACSQKLQLPLRSKIWKGQSGEFAGAGVGSSIDFHDHRSYVAGDDPRHINWQAYARSGQYTMKLYREEVRPVVDLAVDVSSSMFLNEEKTKRVAELIYFFCHGAIRSSVSLNIFFICGDSLKAVDNDSIMSHRWFTQATDMQHLAVKNATHAPEIRKIPWRANAIHILLSDLLYEGDPQPFINHLVNRQGSGLIFAPYSASESDPTWEGNCDFIDSETLERHPHRIDQKALDRYLSAYQNHFELWSETAARYQVKLCRVQSNAELHNALLTTGLRSGVLEVSS